MSNSESSDEDKQEVVDEPAASPSSTPHPHSPTPPLPSLPVFPLPVAPDAPSKATLALQGLDKALLTAELIDPTLSVPLDSIDKHVGRSVSQNVQPVLSEKMKKRLRELGIVELFAGALILLHFILKYLSPEMILHSFSVQTALLPFLLPAERRLRALYLPYNPPRDVCASAPTGSGKTLAYVVPIVEVSIVRRLQLRVHLYIYIF